ncbi:hypothetical protein PC121_g1328 [Phytophthora cactorum]|nr:hypothetical protein PC121_g1328 [Phytophthora cactorum]
MSEGSEQTIVVAPPPDERVFSSWEALEDYLDTYTAQTVQVFSRPTNTSVEERNSMIDSTHSTAAKILLTGSKPTCAPSGDILSRFKMIDAGIKITPPVARKISSLPAVKPLTSPGSTSQIRRSEYIKMCFSEVAALRSKYNCLEQDVALEIIVLGVYSSETLETMTKWHKAIKTIKLVKKAVAWISAIEFALPAPP